MKKRVLCLLTVLLLLFFLPLTASANSAEPPGMIILVTDAPEDLVLTLQLVDGTEGSHRIYTVEKAWETQYQLYYHLDMPQLENAVIRVESGGESFTCPLPSGVDRGYRNVLTLDLTAKQLTLGQSWWRQSALTALRVTLTLVLEGSVFFLFGFRQKRSWLAFLAVNLVTQLLLNAMINSYAFSGGYWTVVFVLAELGVLIAESVAFSMLLAEKKPGRRILYAIIANVLSLLLGGQLISRLPI